MSVRRHSRQEPFMRIYYDIDLGGRTIAKRELHGEDVVKAGRYLIAKTLVEMGAATVEPLSPRNPLIFSAGPFAGTSWSNANRTSVGCKSPLTGGVKEANGGGTFSYGLGQLKIAGLTLHGASPSWVVLHVKKGGDIDFDDAKKVNAAIKDYAKMLLADSIVTNFYAKIGTMGMADLQNTLGGLPVRNFSAGQLVNVSTGEKFKMGGEYISQLNVSRGGEHTHACMPGCVIQCSNVYHDASGKEVVSPVEYETLGLLGTNCGISDPDDLAQLNFIANDLGVDTIEVGAMLAVLMEAGLGSFGDVRFMADCLSEIARGTEKGRLWAQGTARVGAHYGVRRTPVIKKQAISAYDPRVVEATGIAMMATAQGADHTAGNLPRLKTREMDIAQIIEQSLAHQARIAANDSLGLCIFGMSVTNPNTEFLANAINAAHGTELTKDLDRKSVV